MKKCSMVMLFLMLCLLCEKTEYSTEKKKKIPLKINKNYANNHLKTK